MHGKDRLGEDILGRANHRLEETLIRKRAGTARNLDDERSAEGRIDGLFVRSLLSQAAPEKPHGLLQVVDVVSPHRVLAVCLLEQIFRRDDHGNTPWFAYSRLTGRN